MSWKPSLAAVALVLAGCGSCKETRTSAGADTAAAPAVFSVPELARDDETITLKGPDDVSLRRAELIKLVWGAEGMPDKTLPAVTKGVPSPLEAAVMPNVKRVDRLVFSMDLGIQNEAFHYVPELSNGRLVVVQSGHDPLAKSGLAPVIAALVADGYGVLAAQMPCYSAIPCAGVAKGSSIHNRLMKLRPPTGTALKFLLEHLPVALHYLRTESERGDFAPYHDVSMVGLSGGGWTTVVYAAIDPTVQTSFSCSGSEPMYRRHCSGTGGGCIDGYLGDAEGMWFPLYKHVAGYLDLYAMGASGPGRKQVDVQIRHDRCCFGEDQYQAIPGRSWNQAVRADEQKIERFLGPGDYGSFRYEVDETSARMHVISPTTVVEVILAELDGDRRPFGAASRASVFARDPIEPSLTVGPPWSRTKLPLVGAPFAVGSPSGTDVFYRDVADVLTRARRAPPAAPQNGAVPLDGGATPPPSEGSFIPESIAGGPVASDPAAAEVGDVAHVVAVSPTSHLNHWTIKGTDRAVMEVADADTLVVGAPALVAAADGSLDAFVRTLAGGAQHVFLRNAVWSTEPASSAKFRGFPTAVRASDGTVRMFARGEDDTLMEVVVPAAGAPKDGLTARRVLDPQDPPTTISGSPSATIAANGAILVAARRPSGDVELFTFAGKTGWTHRTATRATGAAPAGTTGFTFSPVAVPEGVFARSAEGSVWFYDLKSATWRNEGGFVR